MANNKFMQFCNSINYNTYNNIQSIAGFSAIGLALANEFVIPQNLILNRSVDIVSFISLATYLGLAWSNGNKYTKDINQIKELYYEFIKNYSKLNKIFDLNDPIQIHTMFNYLLYKGYLSQGKEFEFSSKQARDIKSLYGANVITGSGVCRHISAMLTDILNESGIESSQLGVYSTGYTIEINIIEEQKYTKGELITWVRTHITDEKNYKFVMQLIEQITDELHKNVELSYEKKDIKNPFIKKIGNHAISFAFKDGKSYFLDPTQSRIYRMDELDKKILYDDEGQLPIRNIISIVLNDSKEYLRNRKIFSNCISTISKDEENQMIDSTLGICNDNTDIFEKFYRENNELYNDISSKILKIKKGKSFIK